MKTIEMGRINHSYKVLPYLLILDEIDQIQNYFEKSTLEDLVNFDFKFKHMTW